MLDSNTVNIQLKLHPRQIEALETPATELLFGGASRGGKSHFVRAALTLWCLDIPGLQCKIFRKYSEDVIANHMLTETGFRAMLAPLVERKLVQIVEDEVRFLFNGSLISLHHCQQEKDVEKHQGRPAHVLVLDEATQIEARHIKFLSGWVTMTEEMKERLPDKYKGKFPRIIYTANPIGVSVGHFKKHFVKSRPPFAIERVGAFLRQFIPSKVEDNPSESREALVGRMAGLEDPEKASALVDGNWDASIGDFFTEWDEERHVVDDFTPPAHWFRYRSFDWGTAEPFAVYWWAVSDGESFRGPNGETMWFPRGCLIAYREWYGCNPERAAEGLRYRNEDMAYGIIARSYAPEERNLTTVTDSLPFQDRGGKTIAETFADCGVHLTLGDTSRVAGWSQLRSRLIGIEVDSNDKRRTPMIVFCRSCSAARDYLPALPRHPSENKKEDAAEHGEATHSPDAIRLAVMARPMVVDADPPPFDTSKIKNEITFEQAFKRHQQFKRRVSSGIY